MIPSIIHLCWLSGDPYPPLIEKCLESWKKQLPDYSIKIWNAESIDLESNIWLKQAYSVKKYAFASDYIRFYALYNYGGIYLDADVEVLKSFNSLLHLKYFIGEEAGGDVEAAVIGAEKGLNWIKECLDYYDGRPFILADGSYDMRPVPLLINSKVKTHHLNLFPYTLFSPKDFNVGKIDISDDTYCVHHFDGKWVVNGKIPVLKRNLHKLIYYVLGRTGHNKLVHMIRPLIGH